MFVNVFPSTNQCHVCISRSTTMSVILATIDARSSWKLFLFIFFIGESEESDSFQMMQKIVNHETLLGPVVSDNYSSFEFNLRHFSLHKFLFE